MNKSGRGRGIIWLRIMGRSHQDCSVNVSLNQAQEDTIEEVFGICRNVFLGSTNVDKVKDTIQIGFVCMGYREILSIKLCIRNVLQVILEFLQVEPRLVVEGVISVNIWLVGICWRRR